MPVLEHGALRDDSWRFVADGEAAPAAGAILSPARLRAEAAGPDRGVRLEPGEEPEAIADLLGRVRLVELVMPAFRDGRAFSQARALREHHRFAGIIRVSGHVLPDQVGFLSRCGVDEVVLPEAVDPQAFRDAVPRFSVTYQPMAVAAPAG